MIDVNRDNTALLITDPQNDFLSPDGATWSMVGKNVTENKTVENIEGLLKAAKENRIQVFIAPHYYYPTDHGWKFEGTLEKVMHDINMFDRKGPLNVDDFSGSGADWLERYRSRPAGRRRPRPCRGCLSQWPAGSGRGPRVGRRRRAWVPPV